MNGMMPSYTRQARNESETPQAKRRQKELQGPVKVYSKRAIKEMNRQLRESGKLSLAKEDQTQ